MKTETIFRDSNYPLRIAADANLLVERAELRVIEKNDFKNWRFSFIENKAVQDCTNWDASWFANYE